MAERILSTDFNQNNIDQDSNLIKKELKFDDVLHFLQKGVPNSLINYKLIGMFKRIGISKLFLKIDPVH